MEQTQTLMQTSMIERFLAESASARRGADVLRAAMAALAEEAQGALVAVRGRSGTLRVRAATGSCARLEGAEVQPGDGRREPDDLAPDGPATGGAFHVATVGGGGALLAAHTTDSAAEEPAALRTLARVAVSEIERVRARRAAAAARREVNQLRGRNGFLIRGVSHDLKNPIGAIDGYVQLLDAGVRGELTDGQREWTGRIARALQSMLALINDLLDMARVDSSALAIESQPLPLAAIVREALQAVQPTAEKNGIRLEIEIPADLPPALADMSRVRQAIDKLFGFALRTSSEGDVLRGSLSRETIDGGRQAVALRLAFDSCPADRALQAKMLEGLVKTEAAPGSEPGTGLEIALARRLARAMHGDLQFSGDGKTPALHLVFPAAAPR